MLNKRSAFIITKPLQLLVSLSICQEYKFSIRPLFIIVDLFAGSKNVSDRFHETFSGSIDVVFVKTKGEAYAFCKKIKVDNLFIDSDVGVLNYFSLALLKLSINRLYIFVYEEGLGTYRKDLYSGLKKIVLSCMGVGVNFGGAAVSSKIFIYNPCEYKKNFPSLHKKVIGIKHGLMEVLTENLDYFCYVFDFKLELSQSSKSHCYLYLSSWCINEDVILRLEKASCDCYLKLHPHMKNAPTSDRFIVLPNQAPAELVILYLLSIYDKIFIFDQNSSVRRYISCERVVFYNLSKSVNNVFDVNK